MRAPTFGATLAPIATAWALAGWGVALLTLRLDPSLAARSADAVVLCGYGVAAGVVCGGLIALGVWLVARPLAAVGGQRLARALWLGAALAPLIYFALLPDTGLTGRLLTDLVFSGSGGRRLALAGAFVAGCAALGAGVDQLIDRWGTRLRPGLVWLLGVVGLGGLMGIALWPSSGLREATVETEATALPIAGDPNPSPVVLLLSDGVDPRVVRELVDAGELPTFARLEREGTHGPLGTLIPTLSPIIWTTIATGRPPEEHGIRHFLYFRLPGMSAPIGQWPLHTGLNFEIFPRLEKWFGSGLRRPYTSAMRQSDALWDLVGRFHRVGVYRWLLSWPAEPVDGFFVAGGMGWVDLGGSSNAQVMELAAEDQVGASFYPADLWADGRPPRFETTESAMAEILTPGMDPDDPRLRSWRGAVQEPTLAELPILIERFEPAFVAASFQPVDGAHHLFGQLRGRDGPFGGTVDVFYHLLDRRLGELLDRLGPETRVLLISDHGFDFEHGHHTHGPPGVFYGLGPGFAAGRVVEGLTVYDLAPIVLRLLDLPVPRDLRGTVAGRYAEALDSDWLATRPERQIASYGVRHRRDVTPIEDDAELKELLETLGYVE